MPQQTVTAMTPKKGTIAGSASQALDIFLASCGESSGGLHTEVDGVHDNVIAQESETGEFL